VKPEYMTLNKNRTRYPVKYKHTGIHNLSVYRN